MSDALWIILVGCLVASSCALVGCFLVLRKLAMLGDAISHAVLPGIVIAFMLTGSRNVVPMLLGAGAMGLLTVFITDVLNRFGKLQSDASMGVTFTWLFAIGVILVTRYTAQVDLDVDCVLYGDILYAPFDVWAFGSHLVAPRAAWLLGVVTLVNAIVLLLGYKQFKVCTFDPALAASMGIQVAFWHYLLMGLVSVTTVASFESVGAILVVAMLVIPANTAYLLTERLSRMILLAILLGCTSAIGGYWLAERLDASIAAAMGVVAGLQFILAALFAPRSGVISRLRGPRGAGLQLPENSEGTNATAQHVVNS